MKQYQSIGINFVCVAVLAVVSAGVLAEGSVGSAAGKVDQVYGRASAIPATAIESAVHVTRKAAVSEVDGRGSQISTAGADRVDASQTGVGHFGRSSPPAMAAKFKAQGDTLAQKH